MVLLGKDTTKTFSSILKNFTQTYQNGHDKDLEAFRALHYLIRNIFDKTNFSKLGKLICQLYLIKISSNFQVYILVLLKMEGNCKPWNCLKQNQARIDIDLFQFSMAASHTWDPYLKIHNLKIHKRQNNFSNKVFITKQ